MRQIGCVTMILALQFLTTPTAEAQQYSSRHFWISAGMGAASPDNLAVSITGNYRFKTDRIVGARLLHSESFLVFWGPRNDVTEVAALYSWTKTSRFAGASGGAGIGVLNGNTFRSESWGWFDSRTTELRHYVTVGVPIDVHLRLIPSKYIGIGLHGFANVNPVQTIYGAGLHVQVGVIRPSALPRNG